MANLQKRVAENVAGDYFVDSTCIDCDTCRQIAPATFGDGANTAFVFSQPETVKDRRDAMRALVSCPTGSIGCQGNDDPKQVLTDFPLLVEKPVFYCGFNSPKSYGGNSYFVQRAEGNWMIDSPKFVSSMVRQLESLGGISHIFLTHEDDVADAARYAEHFGACRVIHRAELDSQPDAEMVLDGFEPLELLPGVVAIPSPGHTRGHMVLLLENRFLFTGDHLYWDRATGRLAAYHDYCWHSWAQQTESMRRLSEFEFEWVLPGHGQRVCLAREEMQRQIRALAKQMQTEQS